MPYSLRKRSIALAAGLTTLLAAQAVAQEVVPRQTDRVTQPGIQESRTVQPGSSQASSDVDRYLAACWAAHNKGEIELSRIAERQAQSPQVKQFAQMMVQEHGQLAQQLQQLAGGQREQATTASPSTAQRDVAGQRTTTQGREGNDQLVNRLIAIDKQIVDRKTEMARQELESKEGLAFDKCYIGSQVGAHMQASAALDVMAQQASGQLKQLASQSKQTIDNHLEQAKQIAQQLEGQQQVGPRQAERPQPGVRRDRELQPAGAEQR
jgi:predicted outer membrane protein